MPEEFGPIDWSYSNSRLYESCPRAFFYRQQMLAADSNEWINKESDEIFGPSPGALIGSAVHQSISHQIRRWRDGKRTSMKVAQAEAADRIRETMSAHGSVVKASHGDEQQSNSEEMTESLIQTAKSHLQTFFRVIWPQFNSHRYILHEESMAFSVAGNTVWVRPDLCTRDEQGKFVITDWKTGALDPFGGPSLQLLSYALWAHQNYEPELERLLAQLVYTGNGDFERETFDESDIRTIIERIEADCETWNAHSNEADFETRPELEKCQRCPYVHQCQDGQKMVATEAKNGEETP